MSDVMKTFNNSPEFAQWTKAEAKVSKSILLYLKQIAQEGWVSPEFVNHVLFWEIKGWKIDTFVQALLHVISVQQGVRLMVNASLNSELLKKDNPGIVAQLEAVKWNFSIAWLFHDCWKWDKQVRGIINSDRKFEDIDNKEWQIIRSHTTIWRQAIMWLTDSTIDPLTKCLAAEIAWGHHESEDGGWYPDWLSWDSIPVTARIAAIVDVFDAISWPRPYSPEVKESRLVLEIMKNDPRHKGQFNPDLFKVFEKNIDGLVFVRRQTIDFIIWTIRNSMWKNKKEVDRIITEAWFWSMWLV